MVVFRESRSRGFNSADFVVDLDYLSSAPEGALLDALDAIYELLCCSDVSAVDAPDAIAGAILILARLKDIRDRGLASTYNNSRKDRMNWGNADDYLTPVG